jgi:tetratricopeptide (TPR) repeat protein
VSRRRPASPASRPARAVAPPFFPPSPQTLWLAAALIAGAGLLAYANTFSAPFVFDDTNAITNNPSIRHLATALTPPVSAGSAAARPLVNLSFAFNYALGGERVEGYHALNLLIHLAASLALFGLVRRTLLLPRLRAHWGAAALPVAFFTALLWTVHPLLTESVTCIAQRTESLVGLWYLLMFYGLARAAEADEKTRARLQSRPLFAVATGVPACGIGGNVQTGRQGRLPLQGPPTLQTSPRSPSTGSEHSPPDELARHERRPKAGVEWLALSFAACLLGMLTKEVMVAAPLLAVCYHALLVDGSWRAAWQRRRKFFSLLALTWIPLAWLVAHNQSRYGAAGFGLGVAWWEYALTECRALVRYLALSFWPHPLVLDYGDAVVRHPGEVWPQALLIAGLLATTAVAVFRKLPAAFAGLWCFAILAPSSSVLPLITQTIAEHRMYLPLACLIVLAVTGSYALAGRRSYLFLAPLAVVLLVLTVQRNAVYRTALGLWADTVARAPDNARAHNNLANLLDDAGRGDEAERSYERAITLQPGYALAHFNLANLLARQNRLDDAIARYRESLRLEPGSADTHLNLGNTYALQGRWPEAKAEFDAALRLNPEDAAAHNNLGDALFHLNRPAEAVPHYEAALRVFSNPTFHFNLGTSLAALGRLPEAITHFQATVQADPARADAFYRLGVLLAGTGRRDEAVTALRESLRLRPDYAEARQQLARLGAPAP